MSIRPHGRAGALARPLLLLLAAAALTPACRGKGAVPARAAGTNVLLVSVDTLRRDHLPAYGYPRATAPALDRLARESVVFDTAIAVHTNTAPAHSSMLSGLYPATHGAWSNEARVRDEVVLLPQLLRERGYATAAFVSGATLGPHVGLGRAFDLYDAELGGHLQRPARTTARAALRWLERQAAEERSFFLFVHFFEPHQSYSPPKAMAARFRAPGRSPLPPIPLDDRRGGDHATAFSAAEIEELVALYDGEIATADVQVGRLLDALERLQLAERTLVIFTADHGETLDDRAWMFDHGARVYDEQVRVPLMIRLPDGRWSGRRFAPQVSQVDLLPTVLELLGFERPGPLAGRSLVPLLARTEPPSASPLVYSSARCEPERVPEVAAELVAKRLVHSVRDGRFKLIEYPGVKGPVRQLFDLVADPGERRNVLASEPAAAERLGTALDRWKRATGANDLGTPPPLDEALRRDLEALGYL